uniref:NADH-ubiquinone oxidoreductase chain 6 n=1 Tax=Palpitomonas bilix TaxID=652834 RepID=A0A1E1GHQ0_9EUKA|nr:NADH dehydrogenase subunit 6 [Palpitomonas bilix]BAV82404.1 NADH dehydrogenase subunit 6 [Palpitomonas bilix]
MNIELVFFYFFTSLAIISSILVITVHNPVNSVLFLIFVFFNSTAILLLLQAEFLATVFLIVYVGAIAVLFLFIVMMLNIQKIKEKKPNFNYFLIGFLIIFSFLSQLFETFNINIIPLVLDSNNFYLNNNYIDWSLYLVHTTNLHLIGQVLYTNYFYLFLVAGLILLVAMIASIVLTVHKSKNVKRQNIATQTLRSFDNAIRLKTLK